MKETKVYVDEEPRKIATQLVDLENEQFNCVMLLFDTDIKPVEVVIDPKLKTHDRELVKEVCEKIRSELEKELKYDFTSYVPIMNVCNKINRVLDQIQKEYEK